MPAEQDISKSAEREARAKKEDEEHDMNVSLASAYWQEKANPKNWDCVRAYLSVYR